MPAFVGTNDVDTLGRHFSWEASSWSLHTSSTLGTLRIKASDPVSLDRTTVASSTLFHSLRRRLGSHGSLVGWFMPHTAAAAVCGGKGGGCCSLLLIASGVESCQG